MSSNVEDTIASLAWDAAYSNYTRVCHDWQHTNAYPYTKEWDRLRQRVIAASESYRVAYLYLINRMRKDDPAKMEYSHALQGERWSGFSPVHDRVE